MKLDDFEIFNGLFGYEIHKYKGNDSVINVPSKYDGNQIKYICSYAFASNNSIEHVCIHHGISDIGAYAFRNCKNLKTVVLPDTVNKINITAFKGCDNLKEIIFKGNKKQKSNITIYGTSSTYRFPYDKIKIAPESELSKFLNNTEEPIIEDQNHKK